MATRVRRKLNTTADDPAWGTSQIDPMMLRVTVASAEAGAFVVTLTPEDTSIAPLEIEFEGTDDDEAAVAAGLAARANALAATKPGWDFLEPLSSSSDAVLALAVHPNAPALVASFSAPGSATLTPDHTGSLPILAKGDGKGSLAVTLVATTSAGVPLAPGSGTANLQVIRRIDRTRPLGQHGPHDHDAPAAVEIAASVSAQPLNEPWIVPRPNGHFTVRIDTDTSMPGSIGALEVWVEGVDTPLPPPEVTVEVQGA